MTAELVWVLAAPVQLGGTASSILRMLVRIKEHVSTAPDRDTTRQLLAFAVKNCQGRGCIPPGEYREHLLGAGVPVKVLPEENDHGFGKLFGKTCNADFCDFFPVRPN